MNQAIYNRPEITSWEQKMNLPGITYKNFQHVPQGSGRHLSGFSLVELMVAVVIGMLGIIVMMQMFSMFEGQKRTTSSGDDAISSGAVSLYGIQRNIQQSGWGISSPQLIGCSVSGLLSGGEDLPFVPVRVNPEISGAPLITGQDGNTDTLLIVSGNGNGTVEGDNIDSVPAANSYAVHTPTAFSAGPPSDWVVAVPQTRPAACNLALTKVTGVVSPNVNVVAGFAGIASGDRLFNLGVAPTVLAYAIRGGNLTVCDYTTNDCGDSTNNDDATIWVPIANNVVSLRAEYGRDTTAAMDGIVDIWDQTTPTTACGLLRTSAVRIVLVARSSQPEKTLDGGAHVTPVVPVWAGSDAVAVGVNAAEAAAVAISLPSPNATWPTWQDFRYKVFQTTVPLRNITSMGVVTGC